MHHTKTKNLVQFVLLFTVQAKIRTYLTKSYLLHLLTEGLGNCRMVQSMVGLSSIVLLRQGRMSVGKQWCGRKVLDIDDLSHVWLFVDGQLKLVTRLLTILYTITTFASARLSCRVGQSSCCNSLVTIAVWLYSFLTNLVALRCNLSNLLFGDGALPSTVDLAAPDME